MGKHKVKLYKIELMSEVEVDAGSEAEAVEKAEAIASAGGCKFYRPDRTLISLIYKEAPKRARGSRSQGGQDDGA